MDNLKVFMNMNKENRMVDMVEKVIEKLILPKYPEISSSYIERVETMDERIAYLVHYNIEGEMNKERKNELRDETNSLFNMLAPERNELIQVYLDF